MAEGAVQTQPERNDLDRAAMGARVRSLRQKLGLSSGELALQAGVSVGIISQIERGVANPSLRTLERIRIALNVPLTILLEGHVKPGSDPAFVRRRHERPRIVGAVSGLSKEILSPPETEGLRFMIITLPPEARSKEVVLGPGQKSGLVLKGLIRLVVADEEARLAEGDSFQFDSTLPHQLINDTEATAEVLWIMTTQSQPTQL